MDENVAPLEARLDSLDLSLFNGIPTQSAEGDRRAWLAIQRLVRVPTGYTYLEIGSHLGGSLQQHLMDPLCRRIISIDKRPASQADDRGKRYFYDDNSTERMLENLRQIGQGDLKKLITYDADASEIDPAAIAERVSFCMIDGEHTHAAALADFEFCFKVCAPNAIVCFHDDWVVLPALDKITSRLRKEGVRFRARKFKGSTFALFLGSRDPGSDPYIRKFSRDGIRWLRIRKLRRAFRRFGDKLRFKLPSGRTT